jgi:carboxyl-terminal processing protease
VNQLKKKGLFSVLAAVVAIGATATVIQTQSGAAQRAAFLKIAHTVASTGAIVSGEPAEALTLAALRYTHPDSVNNADDAGKAAFLIAKMLESDHYSHTPINEKISSKFLDEYLDNLDPLHLYFLKSDLDEFEKYRTQLGALIVSKGDLSPSKVIFARFKQRFLAHMDYALKTIPTAKFDFSTDEMFQVDRKKAPYPATEAEQQELWQARLKYEYLQEILNKQKPDQIVKTLTRRYNRLERAINELDDDDTEERYLSSLMHVYDPHSDYRGRASTENFNIQMRLSLFGIGAQLQSEDGYVKIMELIPGGPAIKSKQLKPGDRIVAVAQGDKGEPVDTVDMKVDKVVEMIRGPKDTQVRLTIVPADAPDTSTRKTVTLVRDQIKLEEQGAKGRIFEMPSTGGQTKRVGYIDLPSFYGDDKGKSASSDVAILLKKMQEQKVTGVILDLRRNGGGLLDEAVNVAGLFIKTGPVVQVRDSSNHTEVKEDTDPSVAYDGPLVVLTSRLSASASEIVAGALQDYGRAVIVGDTSTFGKGTVQAVVGLSPILKSIQLATRNDPGSLTLTIQKFYRPSGASTQLKGVEPDITLPSITDVLDIAEKSLDNPLPWDTIPSSSFTRLNRVEPFIAQLRQRSADRVTSDKEFAILKEQVALARKTSQEKTVSLNETKRTLEKSEAEARSKRWKTQLAALPDPNEKIYPLSISDAEKPGLPPAQTPRQLADATKKAAASRVPESDDTEEDVNAPIERDVLLDETKRIVIDYAALLHK